MAQWLAFGWFFDAILLTFSYRHLLPSPIDLPSTTDRVDGVRNMSRSHLTFLDRWRVHGALRRAAAFTVLILQSGEAYHSRDQILHWDS